jgi:WD40 repeat protein
MAIHPKGRLACGTMDGEIIIISGKSSRSKKILKGHSGLVSDLRILGEGRRLLSTGWDCSTRLWYLGKEPRDPKILNHNTEVKSIAVDHDGTKGASGSRDGEVKVFSLKSMKCVRNIQAHDSDVSGIFFSTDGTRIVTTSWAGETKLWALGNYDEVRSISCSKVRVRSVHPLPDDSFLLGLHDGSITRISLADGSKMTEFNNHRDIVSSMMLDPTGTRVISGSWDRTVRIWSLDTGEEELQVRIPTGISAVAWHPKGKKFYTADFSGTLLLWTLDE